MTSLGKVSTLFQQERCNIAWYNTLMIDVSKCIDKLIKIKDKTMVYVLEVYTYKDKKKHQIMFSENSIKLNKFIDLTIEYHTDWNFCSRTFREFCTGRCSDDWLDDFESLFFTLNINLGKECDWWNELGVSEIELDVVKYL